jgi:negative regulator of genetic competence, sporulation and motility
MHFFSPLYQVLSLKQNVDGRAEDNQSHRLKLRVLKSNEKKKKKNENQNSTEILVQFRSIYQVVDVVVKSVGGSKH